MKDKSAQQLVLSSFPLHTHTLSFEFLFLEKNKGMERIRHTYTVHSPPKKYEMVGEHPAARAGNQYRKTTSCLETSPQPEQGDRGRIQLLGLI
jgi:hypothetical protein